MKGFKANLAAIKHQQWCQQLISPKLYSSAVLDSKWGAEGELEGCRWFILDWDTVVVLQVGTAALIKCFDIPNKSSVFYCD